MPRCLRRVDRDVWQASIDYRSRLDIVRSRLTVGPLVGDVGRIPAE